MFGKKEPEYLEMFTEKIKKEERDGCSKRAADFLLEEYKKCRISKDEIQEYIWALHCIPDRTGPFKRTVRSTLADRR